MDIATIIGLLAGFGLMGWAILMGGSFMLFVDVPSIIIVFGGTICVLFIKHTMQEVFGSVGVFMKSISVDQKNPEDYVAKMADLANMARKDGLLALEKIKVEDNFLQLGINLCVDGADPDFLESVLNKEVNYLNERHSGWIAVYEGIGDTAPAFGMIGTLIGLVQMLADMSDPSKIGPAMAVALITTFYGAFLANLVAIPISFKLRAYSQKEQLIRKIVIDGLMGIQKGVNPRMLQISLEAAIPPMQREYN
ncbi:MAG: MotA/TolQ/ExbB proton channel family protein [Magnetococcales bacterium]|nr:MotA/TolQ/ExbB proton channel family protein [Magnetococcales bacterium]MBF0156941.1 MotA/TolQ/ExbB proton channel family protein [Magnetococcales bacterium]